MTKRGKAWRDRQRNSPLARINRGVCSNCGEKGPHFIPPGLGDPGMFICPKRER